MAHRDRNAITFISYFNKKGEGAAAARSPRLRRAWIFLLSFSKFESCQIIYRANFKILRFLTRKGVPLDNDIFSNEIPVLFVCHLFSKKFSKLFVVELFVELFQNEQAFVFSFQRRSVINLFALQHRSSREQWWVFSGEWSSAPFFQATP